MKTNPSPHKIGIVSLGCSKNLVDTEVLMKQLQESNFELIVDPAESDNIDTAIINTCGFILDAKNESIETILRFVNLKKLGKLNFLFVMGCLSERYKGQLKDEIPEVDDFYGVGDLKAIVKRVGANYRKELLGYRVLTTPRHFAYLKIAEGCDRRCSFCSIPLIRGKHISKSIEDIVTEARNLALLGVKELLVISQDTTYYGLDLYKKRMIAPLLEKLSAVDGIEWIRLHYTYPDGFPSELTDVIRENDKICKYLDIPLQHINSRILHSMKRGLDSSETEELVYRIRKNIPGVTLRTTLITGYPGETAKEFNELRSFIKKARFDRLGVFTYSAEEDTEAFNLNDSVSAGTKQKRADELMEIQQGISYELNQEKTGRIIRVIIDGENDDFFIGRSEGDSPEIDNEVLIGKSQPLKTGEFYQVKIISAGIFELFAELI